MDSLVSSVRLHAALFTAAAGVSFPLLAATTAPSPHPLGARTGLSPFQYQAATDRLPNYVAGEKWGVQGAPITRMQAPLSPEDSMKHIHLPEGFRVELFASEPDIV